MRLRVIITISAVIMLTIAGVGSVLSGSAKLNNNGATMDINPKVWKILKDLDIDSRDVSVRLVETVPGGAYIATLISENSHAANVNEFGFYYPCKKYPCKSGCRALYRLFEGKDSAGKRVKFNTRDNNPSTPDDFGLWLNSPTDHMHNRARGGLYYSQRALNVDGQPHILIFEVKRVKPPYLPFYIVLCEDWCGGRDSDYDDMIVLLEPILVPPPTPPPTILPRLLPY